MKIIGTMGTSGGDQGWVRMEESFATGPDDLWDACTRPERLARWIGEVSGDLRVDGEFRARFTSEWEGTGRVMACEPPRRLLVATTETGETAETVVEVTLTPEADRTVLVVEERGLPAGHLPAYGAGWQVHVEDLGAHLGGRERGDLAVRWAELIEHYSSAAVR